MFKSRERGGSFLSCEWCVVCICVCLCDLGTVCSVCMLCHVMVVCPVCSKYSCVSWV